MKYLIPASILALLLALSSCGVTHTFTSVSDESLARTFTGDSPQEKYIVKYAGIAVSERKRSGVPAIPLSALPAHPSHIDTNSLRPILSRDATPIVRLSIP